ncbi:tRNA-dihydrouridine synthase 1 [Verticillium dahliae VDG1]|nr:tRNA-dihydrouridine synthase 1 [Verticillium dahliae VDG1]
MEKAVIGRIVDAQYFQYQCFALNEAGIVDRVVNDVKFIGGTYGSAQKPTPFLCLAFKLLQLAPSDDVLETYLSFGGDKFKYLRALACFYIRMTRRARDVYAILERLTFVDEFVDDLLTKTRVCATSFRELPRRTDLVDLGELEERESPLGDIDELLDADDEEQQQEQQQQQQQQQDETPGSRADDESDGEIVERSQNGDRMDVDRSPSPSRSRSRERTP